MSKAHKWADAIIAWAQGKPIQYRILCSNRIGTSMSQWRDCSLDATPNWNHKDYEYRPKPDQSTVFVSLPITGHWPPVHGKWAVEFAGDSEDFKHTSAGLQVVKLTYENGRCIKAELV